MKDIGIIFRQSSIDDSEIILIEKLGGMSNSNYKIQTVTSVYFLRLEKKSKSDVDYGGQFEKEFMISKSLSETGVCPKILYFSNKSNFKVIIQEFIVDEDIAYENINLICSSLEKIQSIPVDQFDYLPIKSPIYLFESKYTSRINCDSTLLSQYRIVQEILKKAPVCSEKFVLCHGDLRRDNVIFHDDVCSFVDREGAYVSDQGLDIVGYYMGNVFFGFAEFSANEFEKYIQLFPHIAPEKLNFFAVLQYFSDLTWLENYVRNEGKKKELFHKNKLVFENILDRYLKLN